jgi:DNA-binding SARP family transcriptional activator
LLNLFKRLSKVSPSPSRTSDNPDSSLSYLLIYKTQVIHLQVLYGALWRVSTKANRE